MDRRVVLAGLAAAVAAAPALAQTSSGTSSTMQPSASGAMNPGPMGQADMQHLQETMRLGMVALETSRVALQKAQNAELKGFARFEAEEQEGLAEVLRSMMEPQATASTGQAATVSSPQSGSTMPAMDAQGQQMLQRLQQASGSDFDKMYLEGQLQGHRDLLQAQERYISSNTRNREHTNVAKLAAGRIREHIAVLESLQQKMR